jgi:hypothetical protein
MYTVETSETSCSGDEHFWTMAEFTTKEKAEAFAATLREWFKYRHFYVHEKDELLVDPESPRDLPYIEQMITQELEEEMLAHNEMD